MRPRRTPTSDAVFRLPGGNEDNDLWVEHVDGQAGPALESIWELTPDERRVISEGGCVRLVVWGGGTPPVAVGVYDGPLGRATT
jgi:hypothetical protein